MARIVARLSRFLGHSQRPHKRRRNADRVRPLIELLEDRITPTELLPNEFEGYTGVPLINQLVAIIDDPDPEATYTASMNWGDGSASSATVVGDLVYADGSHTYAAGEFTAENWPYIAYVVISDGTDQWVSPFPKYLPL